MKVTQNQIDEITKAVATVFRTFGGDRDVSQSNNPIVHAMQGTPAMFAAGVDVEQVVTFVLNSFKPTKKPPKKK